MSAATLLRAYDPATRERLTIALDDADSPQALAAARAALPVASRNLYDLLRLCAPVGEPLPERLRPLIERHGGPLWLSALLLPRPSVLAIEVHPQHYAAACRLNPAAASIPTGLPVAPDFTPSLPPTDARWDAVIVAAALENAPLQLNQDGSVRRDQERRITGVFGKDAERGLLALRVARAMGLVRGSRDKLSGMPEAMPRPLHDPRPLFDGMELRAVDVLMRLAGTDAIAVAPLVDDFAQRCPELLATPASAGWAIERQAVNHALETLQRLGAIDAARDANGISAFRLSTGVSVPTTGFFLTPDLDILVHPGEISALAYGRLARLAPFVEGAGLLRHRLSREGAAAEIAAGHTDTLEFLREHSRTGVPANIVDTLREWQRAASRVTLLIGTDVLEVDGQLRLHVGPLPTTVRIFDYAQPIRARFCMDSERIAVPDGWDALTVRATVARVASLVEHTRGMWLYQPEARRHADPEGLVQRLNESYGGLIPGELELLVRSGGAENPVRGKAAVVLTLPQGLASALRRDAGLALYFRRALTVTEIVVEPGDLPAIQARLEKLGIPLEI